MEVSIGKTGFYGQVKGCFRGVNFVFYASGASADSVMRDLNNEVRKLVAYAKAVF
jgi:hypothetical protein